MNYWDNPEYHKLLKAWGAIDLEYEGEKLVAEERLVTLDRQPLLVVGLVIGILFPLLPLLWYLF